MSILEMIENVTQEMGLPVPSSVVGSSDNQSKQFVKIETGEFPKTSTGKIKRHAYIEN